MGHHDRKNTDTSAIHKAVNKAAAQEKVYVVVVC